MANPGDFAYTLKQQADIVRIIGDYVKLGSRGRQNYSGLCPFHGEKTPSFSVHATRQFITASDAATRETSSAFVQKIENITFPEAVRLVAQKLGIAVPKASLFKPRRSREAQLRGQLLDIHERAVAFFQECLRRPEGARAREYLLGRGLNADTIAQFRIGYAPDSGFLLRDRLKNEFDEEMLRESGLFSWKETGAPSLSVRPLDGQGGDFDSNPGRRPEAESRKPEAEVQGPTSDVRSIYSKFRNRIMFPITSESGKVIAFTGRTLATDEKAGPKYLNSPETAIYSKGRVLFNLDLAKEWVEKVRLRHPGRRPDGLHLRLRRRISQRYRQLWHRFHRTASQVARPIQQERRRQLRPRHRRSESHRAHAGPSDRRRIQIKVLTLEQGFDPDLYIRRKGKDAYENALRHSQKYFDYLIERARTQFPVRNPEGKASRQLSAAPHPTHPQPHRARRTGPGNRAKTEHRFGRFAPGAEATSLPRARRQQ